jgi:hypothetical protein
VFIVASQIGTGELPGEDEATWVVLDLDATTVLDVIRQTRAALEDPPQSVRRARDAWDPG